MSGIKSSITPPGKLLARLNDVLNVVTLTVSQEVEMGAMEIHADAVKSIAAKSSGSRTETRYNPKREQKVSAEGSPPNSDLGTLLQSIKFEIDKPNFTAVVGTNLKYGKALEMGTTKMGARPWLFPAFERQKQKIQKRILAAAKQALGRKPA